jgi:formyltetrahydrofolate deformylase
MGVRARVEVEGVERRGQPQEAEDLLEAVRRNLDNAVHVYHGRTEYRDDVDPEDYQLGLPESFQDRQPDRPVDGLGGVVSRSADGDD